MKSTVLILLDTLYTLALALWFGMLAGLFVVAHPGAPDAAFALFLHRSSALIEVAGIALVAVQFLLRRRYDRYRQLGVADGIRQLLTFSALLLAEFGRYSLLKPGHALVAGEVSTLSLLAAAQMVVLAGVTGITSWLLVTRASAPMPVAPQSAPNVGNGKTVSPPVAAPQAKQVKPTPQRKRK